MRNISAKHTGVKGLPWNAVFCTTVWYLWLSRNRHVFGDEQERSELTLSTLDYHLYEIGVALLHPPTDRVRYEQLQLRWTLPERGFVKLNVDGSALGTSEHSAAGGLCRDSNGEWCFGFTSRLGPGIALHAELQAIKFGLQIAWDRGFRKILLESDSLLAVTKLTTGRIQLNILTPLINCCKELIGRD